MPQQTVYIRNGDMEKWKALENKAAWISAHLEEETSNMVMKAVWEQSKGNTIKTIELKPKKGVNLCKVHGLPLTVYGKCLQKGCKYA